MGITIEDEQTVAMIRRLAERSGRTMQEVVRSAVIAEEAQAVRQPDGGAGIVTPEEKQRRRAATRQIQKEFAALPKTGLAADKAFYDYLNDDDR